MAKHLIHVLTAALVLVSRASAQIGIPDANLPSADIPRIVGESTKTLNSTGKSEWNLSVNYASTIPDKKSKFAVTISRDDFTPIGLQRRVLTLEPSPDSPTPTNRCCVYDPVYFPKLKRWIFKYGEADFRYTSFRLMMLEGDNPKAEVLIGDELWNRNVQISPDGQYISYYIDGNSSDENSTLWVYDIQNRRKQLVGVGKISAYSNQWLGQQLICSYSEKVPGRKKIYRDAIISYDPLTQTRKRIHTSGPKIASGPDWLYGVNKGPNWLWFIERKIELSGYSPRSIRWKKSDKARFKGSFVVSDSTWMDQSGVYFLLQDPIDKKYLTGPGNSLPPSYVISDFKLWKYDLVRREFALVARIPVQSYAQQPTVQVMGHKLKDAVHKTDRFLLSVVTQSKELSPIDLRTARQICELWEVGGASPAKLWDTTNCQGFSVSSDGKPSLEHRVWENLGR